MGRIDALPEKPYGPGNEDYEYDRYRDERDNRVFRVLIVGAGRMGQAIATLMQRRGEPVTLVDSLPPSETIQAVAEAGRYRTIIAAVPYHAVAGLAKLAARVGSNFIDLTEADEVREQVRKIAEVHPNLAFISGAGLAPGYVNTVAGRMVRDGTHDGKVSSVEMFCGALPQIPTNDLNYRFSWSPEGVLKEYLAPALVKRGHECLHVPSLVPVKRLQHSPWIVDLEYAPTGGGAGTTPKTLAAENVAYYTLRYPGHFEQINALLNNFRLYSAPDLAKQVLVQACGYLGSDELDIVYLTVRLVDGAGNELVHAEIIHPQYGLSAVGFATARGVLDALFAIREGRTGFIRPEDF